MDVFQNLFEPLAIAPARGSGREIAGVTAIGAVADELEVRAAAEHAGQAPQHHDADAVVARALQTGAAKVLRGGDVQRVEARRPIDGDRRD